MPAVHSAVSPDGYFPAGEYSLQRGRLVVDIRTTVDKLQRKFDTEVSEDTQMRVHIGAQQLFAAMRTLEDREQRRQRKGGLSRLVFPGNQDVR